MQRMRGVTAAMSAADLGLTGRPTRSLAVSGAVRTGTNPLNKALLSTPYTYFFLSI